MPESLVLLHGFSGTRRGWEQLVARLSGERYLPLALDLPGHGDARPPRKPVDFDSCVAELLPRCPERFALCGYSLGGRVAQWLALSAPGRVTRLVLVSSSPGIEDARERAARRDADRRLADQLERAPFEQFIERWRSQPLFAEDPPHVAALAREDQRRNRPQAIAAALRGLGAGQMPPLWGRLGELEMPVSVVVGERDGKYRALGERMVALLPHGELVVLAGGHALPLESPAALARVLEAAPASPGVS